jgi:hypothetical protein
MSTWRKKQLKLRPTYGKNLKLQTLVSVRFLVSYKIFFRNHAERMMFKKLKIFTIMPSGILDKVTINYGMQQEWRFMNT